MEGRREKEGGRKERTQGPQKERQVQGDLGIPARAGEQAVERVSGLVQASEQVGRQAGSRPAAGRNCFSSMCRKAGRGRQADRRQTEQRGKTGRLNGTASAIHASHQWCTIIVRSAEGAAVA